MNKHKIVNLLIVIHVHASILISGGTLMFYKFITYPDMFHTLPGYLLLIVFFGNLLILLIGARAYQRSKVAKDSDIA
jgi:putative copper export protein